MDIEEIKEEREKLKEEVQILIENFLKSIKGQGLKINFEISETDWYLSQPIRVEFNLKIEI